MKVARNEKRKKLLGFSFYINIGNFEAFLRNLNLSANRLFWRYEKPITCWGNFLMQSILYFFANHVTIKLSQYKTIQRRHWFVSHKSKLNQYYVSRTTPNSSWEKCWVHEGPKHYTTYLWYSSDWILRKKMFISLQNEKLN